MSASRRSSPSLEDLPPGPFALLAGSEASFALSPPAIGREEFPREVLDRNHRNRVLRGALAAVGEHGVPDCSVERIIAAAGVSRYTFYACFPDKEACLLAAHDRSVVWIEEELAAALDGLAGWAGQVATAVARTLELLAAEPGLARLLASEVLCLGAPGQARRRALADRLVGLLRLGRTSYPASSSSIPRLESFLVHGVLAVVDREVLAGRGGDLARLAPDLGVFLLEPYLGVAEAGRVARPPRRAPRR